ncbi:hypothetical protein Tco_1169222 [Tanacetum coccineum]
MANLKFADTHNMVAFLSKPTESEGFEQIMDFLNAHPIKYALTINPTIYISCIEQFWSTIKAKTINGEQQLHALVDGKKVIITETNVRRDLQLEDEEGVDCLPNATIFEQLKLMGMIRNLDNASGKFLMYPRKPKRKDTHVPQHSDLIESVADKAVHKELGDSLVRAATTASSLEAEQDSGARKPWRILLLKLARVESFGDEESLGDDASKQGRIDAIDAYEEITLVSVNDMNVSAGEEVVEEVVKVINTAKLIIDAAQVSVVVDKVSTVGAATTISAATTTTATTVDDINLDQALEELKSTKPKQKGANIDVDHQLAESLQAQEQEELSIEEKATLFQQLLEKRRKNFAAKRAEKKRNKPPTKAQ